MVEAMMTVQAVGAVVVPARQVVYTRQLDGLCIVLLRPCLSLFSRPTMMLTHANITATPPPRLSDDNYHRHCPHSMRSRLYVTVRRPSVRPSVCPIVQQPLRRAASLLLSAPRAGHIGRQRWAPALRSKRRRSTAFGSKCGQCHGDSRGTRLNRDCLLLVSSHDERPSRPPTNRNRQLG